MTSSSGTHCFCTARAPLSTRIMSSRLATRRVIRRDSSRIVSASSRRVSGDSAESGFQQAARRALDAAEWRAKVVRQGTEQGGAQALRLHLHAAGLVALGEGGALERHGCLPHEGLELLPALRVHARPGRRAVPPAPRRTRGPRPAAAGTAPAMREGCWCRSPAICPCSKAHRATPSSLASVPSSFIRRKVTRPAKASSMWRVAAAAISGRLAGGGHLPAERKRTGGALLAGP